MLTLPLTIPVLIFGVAAASAAGGGGALQATWPVHDRQLSPAQMREVQTRLKKMGYDVGEVDGKIGETVRAALRAYQQKTGQVPDGYPTIAGLMKMRQ